MATLDQALPRITTITFDCYGTLIDWKGGLASSFRELLGAVVDEREMDVFDAYVGIEAEEESGRFRCYREILQAVAARMGERFGVRVDAAQAAAFAESLPDWRPFADTNDALVRLKRQFRLGVLSNVDRDLFAGTCRHFDVAFDFVVTAEDVGSYKPALGHFHRYLADHGSAAETLHVAQSLFHDGAPAREFGLAYVWINRYKQTNRAKVTPLAEFPDLSGLARAAGV